MPIRWKRVEIRKFLAKHYPGIDLETRLMKKVLSYFDDDVLYVTVAKKSHRFNAGSGITLENHRDALGFLYDAGLCTVKEYVDTAYQWESALKEQNRKRKGKKK